MFLQKCTHLCSLVTLLFIGISLVISTPVTFFVKREIEVVVEVVTITVTVTVFTLPSSTIIDNNLPNLDISPPRDSDEVQDPPDLLKFTEPGGNLTLLNNPTEENVLDDPEASSSQNIAIKNFISSPLGNPELSENQGAANFSDISANSKTPAIEDVPKQLDLASINDPKVLEPPTINDIPQKQEDLTSIFIPKVPKPLTINDVPKKPEALAVVDIPKIPEVPAMVDIPKVPEAPAVVDIPKVPEAPAVINVPFVAKPLAINNPPKAPEVLTVPKPSITNEAPKIPVVPNNDNSVPVASDNSNDRDSGSSKVSPQKNTPNTKDTSKDQDREVIPDSTPKKKEPEFSSKISSDYETATIERHNAHRFNHSSSELTWNRTLASFALETAKTCVFAHDLKPGDGNYGQNLAAFGSSKGVNSLDKSTLIADAVSNKWYNSEFKFVPFDIAKPSTSGPEFLHLTQMIWKETRSVGCVTFECPSGSIFSIPSMYTVCNYFPAGNILGRFDKQVSRPLGQKIIVATIS